MSNFTLQFELSMERAFHIRFLGVTIGKPLFFESHAAIIVKSVRQLESEIWNKLE